MPPPAPKPQQIHRSKHKGFSLPLTARSCKIHSLLFTQDLTSTRAGVNLFPLISNPLKRHGFESSTHLAHLVLKTSHGWKVAVSLNDRRRKKGLQTLAGLVMNQKYSLQNHIFHKVHVHNFHPQFKLQPFLSALFQWNQGDTMTRGIPFMMFHVLFGCSPLLLPFSCYFFFWLLCIPSDFPWSIPAIHIHPNHCVCAASLC